SGDFSGLSAICDPLTRTASGACTAFTGNRIPAGRVDPIAMALLARVPIPTTPGSVQNLLAVNEEGNRMDQFTGRVDHRLSTNDTLYGRFTAYSVNDTQPFGTSELNESLVPGFGRVVTTRTQNLALGHTHTFGSAFLNEARFGYLNVSGGQASQNEG